MTIAFTHRKNSTAEMLNAQPGSSRSELLALISKVGVTLLSSTGLDDTLKQVVNLVFEAVPADRCVIMLRDEATENGMKIAVARVRAAKTNSLMK